MSRIDVDVAVLGGGGVSDVLALALAKAGRSVVVIEAARVGGECPYVACMPSKAMLHRAHQRSGGGFDPTAYAAAVAHRDEVAEHRDDSGAARTLSEAGVRLVRGMGRITAPHEVTVGDDAIHCGELVITTGSTAVVPPIDGIDGIAMWTSDVALSSDALPRRTVVLGGGPVGCELAEMYAGFGSEVTLIDSAPRLLANEEPAVGETLGRVLAARGVRVMLDSNVERARRDGDHSVLELAGGETVSGDVVIVATGRAPRIPEGLERCGVSTTKTGAIPVDDHLRAEGAAHVWAGGDVTGIAPFTHTASYHGRVLAANLTGGDAVADHTAIPRTVFTEPPVACAGMSSAAAADAGCDVITESQMVRDTARSLTDEMTEGSLTLIADRGRGVLVGAAAVGPRADEWIGEAVIAIGARIPITVLSGVVHPFPTFSELYEEPLRRLAAQLQR